LNFYNWNLRKEQLSTIIQMIDGFIYMFLSRTIGDKERNRWHTNLSVGETTVKNDMMQKPKRSLFGFMGSTGG